MSIQLSPASHELFLRYARDACNWSGQPLVGGNFDHGHTENGYLMDWKKKEMVRTIQEGRWVHLEFLAAGVAYAMEHGVEISD